MRTKQLISSDSNQETLSSSNTKRRNKNSSSIEIKIRAWQENSSGDRAYTSTRKITPQDFAKSNWLQGRIEIPEFADSLSFANWVTILSGIVDSCYKFSNKILEGPDGISSEKDDILFTSQGKQFHSSKVMRLDSEHSSIFV